MKIPLCVDIGNEKLQLFSMTFNTLSVKNLSHICLSSVPLRRRPQNFNELIFSLQNTVKTVIFSACKEILSRGLEISQELHNLVESLCVTKWEVFRHSIRYLTENQWFGTKFLRHLYDQLSKFDRRPFRTGHRCMLLLRNLNKLSLKNGLMKIINNLPL